MANEATPVVRALLLDGRAHLQREDYTRAEDCFARALALAPDDEFARAGLRASKSRTNVILTSDPLEDDGSIDWKAHYEAGADSSIDLPPPLAGDLIADTVTTEVDSESLRATGSTQDVPAVSNPETDPFTWEQDRFSSVEISSDGMPIGTPLQVEESGVTRDEREQVSLEPSRHVQDTADRASDVDPADSEVDDTAPPQSEPPPHFIERGNVIGAVQLEESGLTPIDTLEEPAELEQGDMEVDGLLLLAQRRYEAGDYSGAAGLIDRVLEEDPTHERALEQKRHNDQRILKASEARLGDLARSPRLKLRQEEFVWRSLNHHEGFVLSQVDGMTSFSDLIEISTLPRAEVTRILARLVELGIIA